MLAELPCPLSLAVLSISILSSGKLLPLCHSELYQTNIHTRWTMNQMKESASVKNEVITPSLIPGLFPGVGWLKKQQREEGRVGWAQLCSGNAALSLSVGLVAFIGTNFQNFYWRMKKSDSVLELLSVLSHQLYLLVSAYGIFLSISVCSSLIFSVAKGKRYLGIAKYKVRKFPSVTFQD